MTAIDSGVSPRTHQGIQKRGNACQSLSMWRFNFLDRLSPPTLVSATLEAKDFTAQCSLIGTMVADGMNDWLSSSCWGRLLNEDGSGNGSDFATFGTDETAKLPETHTCGWHQDGEHHGFTNKFQMVVTVWTSKAQRRTAGHVLNDLKGPGGDEWI